MSQNEDLFKADAADIEQSAVSEQVEQAYIDYAMSVIGGRALPDVRDGLKPVQRRVLYKMHDLGVTSNSSHRKSSSIIGETMGDLHPHGDKAIYDSLVRMSQDFSLGIPLVDGQGNFGSMDGDPPAAMRYTEARMSGLAENMLLDIDKDTVDFVPNYDNRLEEPEVLPAAVPNLLVNGASGIAVGMTTDIQPHNIGEVIDATIHRLNNPDCTPDDLMEFVKGPDFPTGATIVGTEGIVDAYRTGKGKIRVRADYDVDYEDKQIIITEIPYQKKKSRIVERIADYIEDGTLDEISDVRDESDREGVRIVIDLKSRSNVDIAENKLIENVLEDTISMNHIALVDGQPQKLSLDKLLDHYIEHRREVVRRRSEYLLDEAEDRKHIVEGRLIALDNIDEIVDTIQDSDDRKSAVERLMDTFDLSKDQADHITRMRLSSLTGLQQEELRTEKSDLEDEIQELNRILNNPDVLDEKISQELKEMKDEHNTERRTSIKQDYQSVKNEDLIPEEDILVVLTENNYIKRISADEFGIQNRGGKGVYGLYNNEDSIVNVVLTNTHNNLLLLTEKGDVHEMKGYEVPMGSRQANGTNLVNLLDVESDERIQAITTKPEELNDYYLCIATENGKVKKTDMSEFDNIWNPGLTAIDLPENDNIVDATVTNGDDDLIFGTRDAQAIRFDETEVRSTGRSSYGVKSIELGDDDAVIGFGSVDKDSDNDILILTETGRGKRTAVSEFRQQSRGGKGMMCMRNPDSELEVFKTLTDDMGTVFVSSKNGKIIRINLDDISRYGRTATGLSVMDIDDDDAVSGSSCCLDN